jgi:hypothetical protein
MYESGLKKKKKIDINWFFSKRGEEEIGGLVEKIDVTIMHLEGCTQ